MNVLRLAAVAALGLGLTGCGDKGPNRQAITGIVKFKGEPVKYGNIQFFPASGSGLEGGAEIKDGAYMILGEVGLPPGSYTVRISAPDRVIVGGPPGSDDPGPRPKEIIPKKYNDETTLKVEVVAKPGGNVIDFDLKP